MTGYCIYRRLHGHHPGNANGGVWQLSWHSSGTWMQLMQICYC